MIYYQQFDGSVAPAGAEKFVTTPEGRAMGHVPGWDMLLDPAHLVGDDGIRNRAARDNVVLNSTAINVSDFANGEPAFHPVSGSTIIGDTDVKINPDAWTVFTVYKYVENSSFTQRIISPKVDLEKVSLQIGFSANGQRAIIYSEGATADATQRLSARVDLQDSQNARIFMFTGSVRDGLRIYADGELLAHDPDDQRPLDAHFSPGEWEVFRGTRSKWGMTGLLSVDLGWAEHSGYRRAIETFLMSKYGISGAA